MLWLAPTTSLFCQHTDVIDSLKNELKKAKGIEQFDPHIQLAIQYVNADKNLCIEHLSTAREIAFQYGDTAKIVRASRTMGEVLRRYDRTDEAIKILNETLPIARRNRLRTDIKYILNSLALVYSIQANYDKALEYHFESLDIREAEGDKEEASISLSNIGFVYFKLKNYDRSVEFYNRSLELKKETSDNHDLDRLLINIGLCYNQLKDFSKAYKYFNQAFSVCGENCKGEIKVEGQYGLGASNFGEGKLHEALVHFEESLRVAREIDFKRFQAENLLSIGKIYILLENTELAIKALKEAENLSIGAGLNEVLIDVYRQFSLLFNNTKDFTNAAEYQNRYINLKDSIYNEALIENIAKVQTDYAERENIATIAAKEILIKQQRDLNFAIAIIAILAGLLILVLQRGNRVTKQVNAKLSEAKQIIEEQNKLLEIKNKGLDKEVERKTIDLERVNLSLKQVNDELDNFIYKTSHDIRGPLASLKGMCNVALMDVKDPIALDYLRKLDTTAERLNTILTRLLIINQINNSKLSIARIDFNSIVNDVLLLEKKKGLPQKLKIRNTINGTVSIQSDKELVRIVLENLIDNAIKFYNDSQRIESFVEIQIVPENDGGVKVRVIDNGIGISESNPGKLFQMFFRASERSEIGGIGLYIVKTATSKLGGRVGLLTTPEGFTEFFVTFPAYPSNLDEGSDRQDFY